MDLTLKSELYNNIKFNMQKLILDVPERDTLWLSRIFAAQEREVEALIEGFENTVLQQVKEIREKGNIPQVHGPKTIVFVGDSITSDRESCLNILKKLYEDEKELKWVDAAISGDKSDDAKMKFYERTMNHHPDIAHVLIGTNDMRRSDDEDGESCLSLEDYRKNLEYIVKRLKANGVKIILTTISPILNEGVRKRFPNDNWIYKEEDIRAVNIIIEETAAKYEVKLNDMRPVYGGYRPEEILFQDGLHLNALGQKLLTGKILAALEEYL